jgi:MFS family permease
VVTRAAIPIPGVPGGARVPLPAGEFRWPGLGWLAAFRVLQAIGGSMLNPVALSISSSTFTHPAERARAIGIWGSVFGVSLALGRSWAGP